MATFTKRDGTVIEPMKKIQGLVMKCETLPPSFSERMGFSEPKMTRRIYTITVECIDAEQLQVGQMVKISWIKE